MSLREPVLVSLVTVLAMATPVATMSPAAAASAKAPTIVGVTPSSASARTGSKLAIKIVAENETKVASASYKLQFLLSKTTSPTGARKIGEGTLSSFAAKTRKTFGFSVAVPSNAAAGAFRLLLCHPRPGQPLRCHQDNVKLTVTLAPAKLTFSPTSHNYGDVAKDSTSAAKRFTVRNAGRRSSGSVAVSLFGTKAASFHIAAKTCASSLAPNATCTVDVTFAPSSTGLVKAGLKVKPSANYSTGATASLAGTGVIPANPAQLAVTSVPDFGSIPAGTATSPQSVTVSNTGGQPSGPITITITGPGFEDFVLSDNACAGIVLAAGADCSVKVKFGPFAPGSSAATFTASATPGGPVTTPLTGTGLAPASLSISPNPYDFGGVETGTAASKTFTVTNTGDVPTDAIGYYIVGGSWFSVSSSTCPAAPLAASAFCTITVQFLPTTANGQTATLKVTGTVVGPVPVNLSGQGASPAALTANPNSLDFSDVEIGTTPVKTFTLTNTGGLPSGALDIYFNGSGVAIDGLTTTCPAVPLPAGASCTIGVRAEPDSASGFGGIVNVLADPPGFGGLVQVFVSGAGVLPPT